MAKNFWMAEVFSQKILRHCETKISTDNRDFSPLPIKTFSNNRIVLENRKVSLPSFSFRSCETIFSTILWSSPPLCMKFFDTRMFLKHRRVVLRSFSAMWDEKTSTEKSDIPHLPPIHKTFSEPKSFWNTEGFRKEVFQHCETRKFQKNRDVPPAPMYESFRYQSYFETQNGPSCEVFRHCETEKFQKKKVISLMHKIFRYRKFSETIKSSPTKIFGPVRQKQFNKTMMLAPPIHENFRKQSFFETQRRSPYEVCRSCETGLFRRINVILPSYPKILFDSIFFLETRGFLNQGFRFGLVRQFFWQ